MGQGRASWLGSCRDGCCLVRGSLGIFPLNLARLSVAGVTLAFQRTFDARNFSPSEQVTVSTADKRLEKWLGGVSAQVVWVSEDGLGLAFASRLAVPPQVLRAALG